MVGLTEQIVSSARLRAIEKTTMPAVTTSEVARTPPFITNPYLRIYYSSDSGYGSIDSSPTKLSTMTMTPSRGNISPRPMASFDGNGSSHDSIDQFDGGDEDESTPTPTRQAKFSTFPRTPNLTRPRPAFAVGNGLRTRRGSDASASERRSSRLGTPNRFLPGREPATPSSGRFRTSKSPEDLTSSERLVRHEKDAPDPFYSRTQAASTPSSSRAGQWHGFGWGGSGTALGPFDQNGNIIRNERQVSLGAVWNIGGLAPSHTGGVDDGHGGLIRSGTNAPIFPTSFHADRPRDEEDQAKHEARIALALKIDRAQRVLDFDQFSSSMRDRSRSEFGTKLKQRKTYWNGTEWTKDNQNATKENIKIKKDTRSLPIAPFKVLDAPNLRDDYYCSVLAYSESCDTLAVALGNTLYSWTERSSVQTLNKGPDDESWLTSIDFSSNAGDRAILAYGRSNGILSLMSLHDCPTLYDVQWPRFQYTLPGPIACLSWRPTVALRRSFNPWAPAVLVENEDLLVGDNMGNIYYLAVEWPDADDILHGNRGTDREARQRRDWRGKINHIITINVHTQQICGLSWAIHGRIFGSGGNDNLCCVFEVDSVLPREEQEERPDIFHPPSPPTSPRLDQATATDDSLELPSASDEPGLFSTGLLFTSTEAMDDSVSLDAPASPPYVPGFLDEDHDPRNWWHRQEADEETRPLEFTPEGDSLGTPRHWQAQSPRDHNATVETDDFPPYHLLDSRFVDRRGQDPSTESVNAATEELAHPVRTAWSRARIRTDGCEKQRWMHTAAVKAIAFCPWQLSLVATGGGSNDKCIHFYHTTSGAALATIAVHAQVTSLIWSTTRREIAATFGYANPEHPYRIAIFSWPECQQVAAIPWEGEHRALYAIPYPRGPVQRGEESDTTARRRRRRDRTTVKGCIVVAASDESIKFHEVWNSEMKATAGGYGMLGGSDILEGLEGIDKDGNIIR